MEFDVLASKLFFNLLGILLSAKQLLIGWYRTHEPLHTKNYRSYIHRAVYVTKLSRLSVCPIVGSQCALLKVRTHTKAWSILSSKLYCGTASVVAVYLNCYSSPWSLSHTILKNHKFSSVLTGIFGPARTLMTFCSFSPNEERKPLVPQNFIL